MDKVLALCTCSCWLVSQNFSLMIHFTFKILLAWHCDIRVRIRKIAESKALALCVANPSTILSTAYASLSIARSSTTRWDPKTKRGHMLPITTNIYLLTHYPSPQATDVTLPPTLLTHNNPFCQTSGNSVYVSRYTHTCVWIQTSVPLAHFFSMTCHYSTVPSGKKNQRIFMENVDLLVFQAA